MDAILSRMSAFVRPRDTHEAEITTTAQLRQFPVFWVL